jgi:hypothetical protein
MPARIAGIMDFTGIRRCTFGSGAPTCSVCLVSRSSVAGSSGPGDPYDGHTLAEQMMQVDPLIGNKVSEVHVDMGNSGYDYDGAVAVHFDQGFSDCAP